MTPGTVWVGTRQNRYQGENVVGVFVCEIVAVGVGLSRTTSVSLMTKLQHATLETMGSLELGVYLFAHNGCCGKQNVVDGAAVGWWWSVQVSSQLNHSSRREACRKARR